jgi:hypothetical protein
VKPWLIEESEQEVLKDIERGFALDRWARQNTYVEVWVEKEALASVIERPCGRFAVPYMSCKGYLSVSEAWRAGQRFEEMLDQGRHCVLIHLGDHDPSGIDMTRDNDDRLALFAGERIDVRRIALNMDQVQRYNPPPTPTKITDSRAGDYIRKHGQTSWELDALQPQVLDKLISDERVADRRWDETLATPRRSTHISTSGNSRKRFDERAPELMLPSSPSKQVDRDSPSCLSTRGRLPPDEQRQSSATSNSGTESLLC